MPQIKQKMKDRGLRDVMDSDDAMEISDQLRLADEEHVLLRARAGLKSRSPSGAASAEPCLHGPTTPSYFYVCPLRTHQIFTSRDSLI